MAKAQTPTAPSDAKRALFVDGIRVDDTVYLRHCYEGKDADGNTQFARPGSMVNIIDITGDANSDVESDTGLHAALRSSDGRRFHGRLHVRRSVNGFEKTVRATVSFRGEQLCASPSEVELV